MKTTLCNWMKIISAKKILTLWFVLLIFFCQQLSAQTLVVVPSANTNGSGDRKPYGCYFGYARTQALYLGSEIGTTGTITAIGFFVNSVSSPATNTPVVIKLKTTTNTTVSTSTYSTASSGTTTVFSGNISSASLSAGSWVTVTLSTPFAYSGNNLTVIVEENYGLFGGEGSTSKQFRQSPTSGNLCQGWEADLIAPTGNGTLTTNRPNIRLTVTSSACSGTPAPGNTLSSSNPACLGSAFTLSLQSPSAQTGISNQWQSSPDGSTWTSIAGANLTTYTTTPTGPLYYRCQVSCSNSGQSAFSSTLLVQTSNCVNMQNGSITTCSAKFYDSGGPTGTYVVFEDYTYTFYPNPGNKIQVTFSAFDLESGYDFLSIFNGNSILAPQLFSGSGTTLPGTYVSSANDGSLTFHFTSDVSINNAGWDATISCISVPACTGTPSPGTVTGTTTICAGSGTVLTATGATVGLSGIQYQWEESDDNGIIDPWTSVMNGSGSTTAVFTTPALSTSVYYRMNILCNNSLLSAASPGQLISITPLPVVTVNAPITSICGTGTVSITANGGTSYSWSPAAGLNNTSAAIVQASPASTTTYTVTGTSSGCSSSATVTINVFQAIGNVSATADTSQGCDPLTTILHANACLNTSPTFNVDSSSTNYSPSGATGFLTMSSTDDGFSGFNLPFSFNYFGTSYTSGFVSTNGFLTFGASSTTLTAQQLPNATTPNNVIALCWNDLLHGATNTGVDTFTIGSPGSRKFVIRFNSGAVAFYNGGSQTGSFGGKIILHESTNKIELRIDVMNMGAITGRLKTLGVENSDGTNGIAAPGKNNTDWLASTAITYVFSPGFTCSGGAGMSYSWSPLTNLSNASTANANVTALTTSTVYTVTVTASSGCTATASIALNVLPKPTAPIISASGPLNFCPGGSVVLTSSSPNSNQWSTGETTVAITVSTTQNITLYTTSGLCASELSTMPVVRYDTIQPLITVLGGGAALCTGTRDLMADGLPQFTSWIWNTTETSQTINISIAGTYSVEATDLNGCLTHNSMTIYPGNTPVSPVITASSGLIVCNNEIVTMSSDLADNILWSPTFDNSASITYPLSPPGVYDFFVTRDSLGCTSESNHLVFTVNPVPEVYSFLPADSACPGDVITLNGSGLSAVTVIQFNGTTAPLFTIVDDFTILVTMPAGATSGALTLLDNTTGCIGVSPVFTKKSSCVSTVTLELKLFLQGYFQSGGSMNPALYNAGMSSDPLDCDSIEICLMDMNTYAEVECADALLSTNGIATVEFSATTLNLDYFIRIRHRNTLESWTAAVVKMLSFTPYDLTIDASTVYGSNEVEVETGTWALWSGDVSDGISPGLQDGFIESSDYSLIENSSQAFLFGYETTDITGDGLVESSDYGVIENNSQLFLISSHP